MNSIKLGLLFALPAVLGATLVASVANATEIVSADGAQSNRGMSRVTSVSQLSGDSSKSDRTTMSQVTSVSQLSDVKPTDWAFQALQSLVERYGCIAGYPDKTYRGNRALTRYEFAAGLNACMDRINELITAATENMATKEDLLALQKLQEEFAAELAMVRGQVDALEVRTATLEEQQFSTTTKLKGEVIFSIAGALGGDKANSTADVDESTTFSDRVRLSLDTSFTGKDLLRTRLNANNTPNFQEATGTNESRLSYDGSTNNNVSVDKLFYRFGSGNFKVQVDATGLEYYDGLITALSPFQSSGSGSISRYGRFSPNLRSVNGAGVTTRFDLSDLFRLEAGYVGGTSSSVADPADKFGLFGGSNKVIAQFVVNPKGNLQFAAAYAHAYYAGGQVGVTASTGSAFANRPFGNVATEVNEATAQLQWKASKQLTLGGWFGYQWANQQTGGDGSADILNWMAFVGVNDFLKEGNLLGLQVGNPPKVVSTGGGLDRNGRDDDTSWHLEAFYRYRLNENISITPGMFVILNPENNNNNDAIYVGTIRTTFTF